MIGFDVECHRCFDGSMGYVKARRFSKIPDKHFPSADRLPKTMTAYGRLAQLIPNSQVPMAAAKQIRPTQIKNKNSYPIYSLYIFIYLYVYMCLCVCMCYMHTSSDSWCNWLPRPEPRFPPPPPILWRLRLSSMPFGLPALDRSGLAWVICTSSAKIYKVWLSKYKLHAWLKLYVYSSYSHWNQSLTVPIRCEYIIHGQIVINAIFDFAQIKQCHISKVCHMLFLEGRLGWLIIK